MLYLQTTQKARNALGLGKERMDLAEPTRSALGNWMVNIVPMGSRQAFFFMSCRSLLSFPIMIGAKQPALQDMPEFLIYGCKRLAAVMALPPKTVSLLLHDFDTVVVCKATDKSLLAGMRAVAADYAYRVDKAGGIDKANLDAVISAVNAVPRQMLGYRTSFEVSAQLLQR